MDTKEIEEKLTGVEAFAYDTTMGIAIVLGWLIAMGRYLLQPEQTEPEYQVWNSREDFRQSGFQPQSQDTSGMVIAVITVAVIVATLIALYPRPL